MKMSTSRMRILRTAKDMRLYRNAIDPSACIGFVPTMGGLHGGHVSLVRAARENDVCIVSIYINSKQFAEGEDLHRYPRTRERDMQYMSDLNVDAVYLPNEDEVYPEGYGTYVYPAVGHPDRNVRAEGAARPTFFRGVGTVLLHLLATVRPHKLYCGQKDAQQCAVMRALVQDLWLPTRVIALDTVRELDGLAMSSRNAYLSDVERKYASVLFHAMCATQELFDGGERMAEKLREAARYFVQHLWKHPSVVALHIEYISICDKESMEEVRGNVAEDRATLICVAGAMGAARLIDNWELRVGGSAASRALIKRCD